jgi:carbon monoxide dehydrogenase subunit G
MNVDNEFKVSLPIAQAWDVLTDLGGIAPCMPGAQLTGSDGGTYSGKVRVKVGPVTTEYTGTATFVEKDGAAYRAVISAKGREARGTGNASATVTAQLRSDGDQTVVSVATDLKISGKVAQFGSSVIAEVSEKLLGQFVDNLEAMLGARSDGHSAGVTATSPTTSGQGEDNEEHAEAIDLVKLAGGSVAKRVVPVAVGAVVVGVVIYVISRR